jgi:hypothetical protein
LEEAMTAPRLDAVALWILVMLLVSVTVGLELTVID